MTLLHERHVSERFDAVQSRFRDEVSAHDFRLEAVIRALGPIDGMRLLDLGCGKGRFARHLQTLGAEVIGIDASRGMLSRATGLDRVLGSATRLPFASGTFDAVIAVEVFEHLPASGIARSLAEIARVLKPGGRVAIVDKNVYSLDANRPFLPKIVVKWIDERRGRWMYPAGGPVRERWFSPRGFSRDLGRFFEGVDAEFLLSSEESNRAIFRKIPHARLMTIWTARAASRVDVLAERVRADLPLSLWRTPPAIERVLRQEGVPIDRVEHPREGGRFVLFDGRSIPPRFVRDSLTRDQVAIDVNDLRNGDGDPFAELIDNRSAHRTWTVGGFELTERVSRFDKAAIRRRIISYLKRAVERAGGVWARLSLYPHPYTSAFNFRADLDEPFLDDYLQFAHARRPIDDCSTHFVSTSAYCRFPEVMDDLKRIDAQSHGHFHHVYRSESDNRRNLERADSLLRRHGFLPSGFAAPCGRWNQGLDRAMEGLGYAYSSDFSLGYDDLPSFPMRDGEASPILQIPVHPICEGLFLDAGCDDPSIIANHLVSTVLGKIASGEPAFVYGHPERRLGVFPEVISALADCVSGVDGLWRVTLTDFAKWWRWRLDRSWSLSLDDGRITVESRDWSSFYPMALEVFRGDRVARVPLIDSIQSIDLESLVYEPVPEPWSPPPSRAAQPSRGVRSMVRSALDWETVTPIDELSEDGLRDRLKKRLRRMREPASSHASGGPRS